MMDVPMPARGPIAIGSELETIATQMHLSERKRVLVIARITFAEKYELSVLPVEHATLQNDVR